MTNSSTSSSFSCGLLAREVLVPAERTEDKVRIKLDRVRLSEVVKTLV